MRILLILLLLPFLCASSCKGGKHRLQSEKGKKIRFEMMSLQKKKGDCSSPGSPCSHVDMVFPLAVEGVPAVQKAVNDTLLKALIQNLVFEEYAGGLSMEQLEAEAEKFLNEWQVERSNDEEAASFPGWEVNVTGEVGLHTPKVATVSLGTYSYAGGAHPNSYVTIFNFDLQSGKALTWEEVVTDVGAVKKLAEKKFKAARELPADADLLEEGYFWGEAFALPQNFEVQEDGIYCWYNPYEAASYSEGPTDFLLTYEELGKLAKKEIIF